MLNLSIQMVSYYMHNCVFDLYLVFLFKGKIGRTLSLKNTTSLRRANQLKVAAFIRYSRHGYGAFLYNYCN